MDMPYKDWIFEQLVKFGAIKDYSRTERSSRGKPPKGNLSVQVGKINELKNSPNVGLQMWGLISYAGLMNKGEVGPKFSKTLQAFCDQAHPKDPAKLMKYMKLAVKTAHLEFKARYKDNPS